MSDLSILLTSKEYAPYTKYWTKKLSSISEPFTLGRKETIKTEREMSSLTFSLGTHQQEVMKKLTQGKALETFIIFLSGYYLLFAKYSGNHHIIVDSPLFNQVNFDNLLVSKVFLLENIDFDNTLKELIIKVNHTVTQSYKYQNFPLATVAQEEDNIQTNVFISFAEIHRATPIPLDSYDFIIEVECSQLALTYNTACFSEDFVQNLTHHYNNILAAYTNVNTCLNEVSLLSESEKQQVLITFNNTQTTYPRDKSIVELFEAQVAKTPEATAIVFADNALIYQELNEKANQLAHYLRTHYHIQPDDFVGILLERSEWMVIAILGILKAGGAYLPIEPDNPIARVQLMLDDSQTAVVLTHQVYVKKFKQAVDIKNLFEVILPDISKHNPTLVNKATDLAYVMYTSGSTGTPKGVLVEHRGVVRLVKNANYTDIKLNDRILQLSNYAFDGSTFDIFGAILNGATLYLFPQELLLSIEELCAFIVHNHINITFITTALFNQIVDVDHTVIAQFDKIYFGGQDASLAHIKTALQHRKHAEAIVHVYGPTEGTTFSTYYVMAISHFWDDEMNRLKSEVFG